MVIVGAIKMYIFEIGQFVVRWKVQEHLESEGSTNYPYVVCYLTASLGLYSVSHKASKTSVLLCMT